MEGQSSIPDAETNDGVLAHLRRVVASLTGYFGARFELVTIEGREAFVHYLKLAVVVAAAVVLLTFGYIFLCFAAVLLVAEWTGIHTGWVSLMFFGLHAVAVIVCLLVARRLLAVPQFQVTLDELRKDQEWLR